MLYAILVEGRGPLGSVFNADDFTDKEVQDTDGDGLPEFVDAWGNPLQFFRWPLLYHSDIQRGQVIQADSENSWTLLPPYQIAVAGPARAGPAGPEPAARGAGVVVGGYNTGGQYFPSEHLPGLAGNVRCQRRGPGVRVLLPSR